MKCKYDITGMNCAACSLAVEKAVSKLGADNVSVNLISGVMSVEFNENTISDSDIRNAVKNAGFGIDKAKSPAEKRLHLQKLNEINEKSLLKRLVSSLIITIILMYFSMGHMLGLPLPAILKTPLTLSIIQFLLTLPVLIINKAYFIGGFRHLLKKTPNMDSLVAVGSASALIYGIFAIIQISIGNTHYVHDLYFETAAMIPTLVTVGKFLEGKSKRGTGKALDMLIDLTPKKAVIITENDEKQIDVADLKPADIVLIKPGQSFPCDGYVLKGESYADESSLTGEGIPVYKTVGSMVNAGTINTTGTLQVQAEKVGDDTVISEIVRLVENASGSKAPISRMADKISAIFVPSVIIISIITFIIWTLCGADFEFAFSRAICVLVISCPCALGLATPVAVTVATGIAAQNGILIKNAATLEELGKVKTVLFDKTGTLTKGTAEVCDILPANLGEEEFLTIAASLEKNSEHPLGIAITNEAEKRNLKLFETDKFEAIIGMGLSAQVGNNTYHAGNISLMNKIGIVIDNDTKKLYNKLCSQGKTPLFFSMGNEYIGCIAVSDKKRDESAKAVNKLTQLGIKPVMITGDNEITAKAIADEIGIEEVCASVTPSGKEQIVIKYTSDGTHAAMCGDGINDAIALARADVGITLSKGTDIAIETSDVVLMRNDIYSLPCAIALSRETISNIKLSLFWALIYNALGIPIAAGILYPVFGIVLNPMIGAAAMSLSSVCVVLNSLRLKKFNFE